MRLLKADQLFRKVIDGGLRKQSRLLGLDVGSKYVGLAVSDDKNRIALPLSVLSRTKTNISLMADDFVTLVSKYSLAGFVVGYPFNLQGQSSRNVKCSCAGSLG
uniref:YqgF/RNase H-like domain-containing protein n=1 Tax=Oryza nivara TaxID=4536 RepID=A0A0E0FTK7_ORYNI